MKRSIIGGLLIPVVLIGLCLSAQTVYALDAPHNTLDKTELITCSSCHYSAASPPLWVSSATLTGDTTKWNLLCFQCHSTGNLPHGAKYEDILTHSSEAIQSNTYGNWTVECRICHSAHNQQQALSYSTDTTSYLRTGTVSGLTTSAAAVTSTITDATAPFTSGAYVGYLLIPNTAYPTTMYRIQGNTTSVITVYGALNPYYAAVGKTYAIRYGKMVNQSVVTSNSGPREVKYYNATGANSLGSGTTSSTTAVCQVCHTLTTSFNNSGAQEAGFHPAGVVAANQPCTDCHTHATGFKAGGCTGCHGSPPSDAATLVFKSRTGATVTSDSPGPGSHVKHTQSAGYGCSTCHYGGMLSGAGQGDDKINIGFNMSGTNLGGNYDGKIGRTVYSYASGTGSTTTVSATGSLTCSSVYCHSTVQVNGGGAGLPTYSNKAWTGAGTVVCGSCHKSDGAQGDLSKMDTGGHTAHLTTSVGATCNTCHSGNTHANRNIEVTNVSYTLGGAPGNGYGSCSNASCHVSVYEDLVITTPMWGTTAGCTACHSVAIASTGPATGSHVAHNDTTCTNCHNAGTTATSKPTTSHIDGNINVTNGYPVIAKHAAGTYTGTCNSASCHQTGISTNNYATTPIWGVNAPNCSVCHAAVPATGAHGVHVTSASYDCSQCHTGATKDTSYASAEHRDLNIDVAVGGYTANKAIGSAKQSCSATQCHGTTSPVWDNLAGTTGNCSLCHGMSANPADGRDTAGHTAPTDSQVGAHVAHLTGVSNYSSAVSCTDCHNVPATVAAAGHIDSALPAEITFSGLSVTNSAAASYNFGTGTCSTVYCHGGKMIYLSTTGTDTRPEWNQTGYLTSMPAQVGDCNKCHGAPPTGYAGSSHSGSETLAQCAGCHGHVDADGSFNNKTLHMDGLVQATGCTGCHGQPPIDAGTMVVTPAPTGRTTVFASSSGGAGAHLFHVNTRGYICNRCHSGGGGGGHQTAYKITFGFTYGLNKGSYTAPTLSSGYTLTTGDPGTTVGTSAARNCTNYCHSSGQAASGGAGDPVFATANWDNVTSGDCGACHATSLMSTGSHTRHISGDNCATCHTDASLSSYASTSHVNTAIDVATSLTYTGSGLSGNGYATCTTASCHDNGRTVIVQTPLWGTSINDCSACHAKQPATGSHTKHLTGTTFHKAACGDCHAGTVEGTTAPAQHLDSNVDVYDVAKGDLGYPQTVAKHNNTTYSNCTTAYCHSSGQSLSSGTNTVPTFATVAWNGTAACGTCHAATKAQVIAANSGGHTKHLNDPGVSGCNACHTGVDAAGTAYSSNTASHVDGRIDVTTALSYTGWGAPGNGYATCTTASCHDNGRNVIVPTQLWGASVPACTACHALQPTTGSHTKHLTGTTFHKAACGDCHGNTVQGVSAMVSHLNSTVEVYDVTAGDMGYPAVAKHNNSIFQNCTTAYCHSSGQALSSGTNTVPVYSSVTWSSTVTCGGCHAATKAQVIAANSGGHTKHLNDPGVSGCDSCHTGVNAAGTAYSSNTASHVDGMIDVATSLTYTGSGLPGNGYATCTNAVACHDNGRGVAAQTPMWGATAPACTACHALQPATGSHTKHLTGTTFHKAACGDCHGNTVEGVSAMVSHLNGTVEVYDVTAGDMGYPAVAKHNNSIFQNCTTAYCHSSGQALSSGTNTVPVYSSVTWSSTVTCGGCHAATKAQVIAANSGGHTKHLNDPGVSGCDSCHTGVNAAGTAYSSNTASHVDGMIDVATSLTYTGSGLPGNGYATCTNAVACHDNGRGVAAQTPMWGATAPACTVCHALQPTTGSHTKHLTGTTFHKAACGDCHGNTVQGVSAMVSHLNGTVEVYDVTAGDMGYPAVAKHNNSIFQNCTTAYCHSSGQALSSGTNTVPVYTSVTWSSTVTCGGCHAASKAQVIAANSGGHAKHLTAPTTVSGCDACHTGVDAAGTTYSSNTASHIDGMIDVKTALSYTGWGSPGNGYATCTASSCHSSGQNESTGSSTGITYRGIMWGTNSNCGSCHKNMANDTTASGSHVGHAQTAGIGCQICHVGYSATAVAASTHVDGLIFTSFSGTGLGTTYSQVSASALGNGYGTCSTNTCHGSSAVVTWGTNTNNGKDTCTKCHGTPTVTVTPANYNVIAPPVSTASVTGNLTGVGQVSDNVKVGAHQTHLLYSNGVRTTGVETIQNRCEFCHGTVPTAGNHADTVSTPTWSGLATRSGAMSPAPTYVGTTCNNTYCHNPAATTGGRLLVVNAGTGTAPGWTNTAYLEDTRKTQANCGKCHKVPGDALFEPAGTHTGMTIAITVCTGCHGHDGDSQGIAGQRHMDGIKYGGGNCDSCHAYDVAGATYAGGIWSGGTWTHATARDGIGQGWGAHAKHINHIKTRLSIATVLNPVSQIYGGAGEPANVCGTCHSNTIGDHAMGGSPLRSINFNGSTVYQFGPSTPLYNGVPGTSSSVSPKSCSNLSCHYQTTPVWSTY